MAMNLLKEYRNGKKLLRISKSDTNASATAATLRIKTIHINVMTSTSARTGRVLNSVSTLTVPSTVNASKVTPRWATPAKSTLQSIRSWFSPTSCTSAALLSMDSLRFSCIISAMQSASITTGGKITFTFPTWISCGVKFRGWRLKIRETSRFSTNKTWKIPMESLSIGWRRIFTGATKADKLSKCPKITEDSGRF